MDVAVYLTRLVGRIGYSTISVWLQYHQCLSFESFLKRELALYLKQLRLGFILEMYTSLLPVFHHLGKVTTSDKTGT